jgi:large conductance mechanosensitive channel
MRKGFKESLLRSDLMTVAVGVATALAAFLLVEAVVVYWIAPVIAIFVGDAHFETNAFKIEGSEFRYGAFIQNALTFVLVLAVAYFVAVVLGRRKHDRKVAGSDARACPECTSSIPTLAKRCPYCTAVVPPEPR